MHNPHKQQILGPPVSLRSGEPDGGPVGKPHMIHR